MSPAKLFIPNLPVSITEARLRMWLNNDPDAIISFTHLGEDMLALVETTSTQEAERLARGLETTKAAGRPLQIVRGNSTMGQRLGKLFQQLRRQEFMVAGARLK